MPRHIYVNTIPPSAPPVGVGHHYVDLTTRRSYISVGTASASDWKASASPETTEVTLSPTDVANNYITLPYRIIPGSVMLFIHGLMWRGGIAYTVEDLETISSTRIHFIGELQAPGGDVAIEPGEVVTVSSLRL